MSLLILQNFLLVLTATFNETLNTLDFTETPVTCIENEKSINSRKFNLGRIDKSIFSSLTDKVIEKVTDYSGKMDDNLKFFDSNNSKEYAEKYKQYLELHLQMRETKDMCRFVSEKILNRIALRTHLVLNLLSDSGFNNLNPDKVKILQNKFLDSLNIVWFRNTEGKLKVRIYDTEKYEIFLDLLESFIDEFVIEDIEISYLKQMFNFKSKTTSKTKLDEKIIDKIQILAKKFVENIFASLMLTCTMIGLFIWFTFKKIYKGVRFLYKYSYKYLYKKYKRRYQKRTITNNFK